jgi:hypothetical protein|tara:strand:- start:1201 stop:1782 length:582 start_codon:yes stop_codon:yes gene_type:complete
MRITSTNVQSFAASLPRTRDDGPVLLSEEECADVVRILSTERVRQAHRSNTRILPGALWDTDFVQEQWDNVLGDIEGAYTGYADLVSEVFDAAGLVIPDIVADKASAAATRERIIDALEQDQSLDDHSEELLIAELSVPAVIALLFRVRVVVTDALVDDPLLIFSKARLSAVAEQAEQDLSDLLATYLAGERS